MGWKKKEKELTLEEALDAARKEQAKHWLQSPPLVTAFPTADGGHAAFPLEESFSSSRWMAIFVDPFTVEGVAALRIFALLRDRYERHDLAPLVVVRSNYERLHLAEELGDLLREMRIPVTAVIDESGSLQAAYGVAERPQLRIIEKGAIFREAASSISPDRTGHLPGWLAGFEGNVQRFLRISDPGLPLAPAHEFPAVSFMRTKRSWRLRIGTDALPVRKASSFIQGANGWSSADFPPFDDKAIPESMELDLAGKWSIDTQRLVTMDPDAGIRLKASGASLRVALATLHPVDPKKRLPPVLMTVHVNGLAVFDEQAGEDLRNSEDGHSEILVNSFRFLEVLKDFDARGPVEIRIGFRGVAESPIVLYGLELGERS